MGEALPSSNHALLKFPKFLFILLYLVYFCPPPKRTLPPPPFKIYLPYLGMYSSCGPGKKNSPSVLSGMGKRTKEGCCDCGSKVGTVHSGRDRKQIRDQVGLRGLKPLPP